ncbi:MAG: family transporter [Ferruginibacter sp.]|nr:family transporter [Ferruginibacter sp.]
MINFKLLPFYIQFTIKLLMILLLCVFITYASSLFVPLAFSILLSILLLPVTNFLENKLKFPKSGANLASVILALSVIGGLIYFLSHQIASFLKDIPSIKEHLHDHYLTLQSWIQQKFHVSAKEQKVMIDSATADVKSSGTEMLGQTFFTITSIIFYIIIIAIYSFLILHYRHMIKRFLLAVFNQAHEPEVIEVLQESKGIVQKYMLGLITEMWIVAMANSLILLIIGVKYAIFLGVFSAILNIIPYVGILTGIVFTCLVTLTTSTQLSDIVWIIVGFEIIHFIDANFLMPRIVGSKVKINALVTIVGVVVGGTLIGLPGIFLALPTIAILKIIFDRIEDMKPWGMLMGDDTRADAKTKLYRQLERTFLRKKKMVVTTVADTPSDTI